MRPLVDLALDAGTILRLTRFVVLDDLGAWLVRYPAYRWASRKDPHGTGWPTKAVSGLDCKWCAGYWVAVGVLGMSLITRRHPGPWRFIQSTLTANYVAATLDGYLQDQDDQEEEE